MGPGQNRVLILPLIKPDGIGKTEKIFIRVKDRNSELFPEGGAGFRSMRIETVV